MPRKTPLPQRESEICGRLLLIRRKLGLSREMFARRSGIETSQLARYEHLRSPILYADAVRVCEVFGLGIAWLASGEGDPAAGVLQLERLTSSLHIPKRARLSAVFDKDLKRVLKEAREQATAKLAELDASLRKLHDFMKSNAPPKKIPKEFRDSQRAMERLMAEMSIESVRRKTLRAALGLNEDARPLTESFTSVTSESMAAAIPPTWDELRSKIASLTKQRGAKTRLAKLLGVSQQAVSEWLTGSSAPSADNTLRLLQWVAAGGK